MQEKNLYFLSMNLNVADLLPIGFVHSSEYTNAESNPTEDIYNGTSTNWKLTC
jgi:hypothetical protein